MNIKPGSIVELLELGPEPIDPRHRVYFAPGTHTEGDGYLYQNRSLSDTFVFPNGRDGKIDSVYVDVDTEEYTGDGE